MNDVLTKLLDGRDLTRAEARGWMEEVMGGSIGEARLAGALVALRIKGETVDEIAGFAEAMRAAAARVDLGCDDAIDTCGTGGDASGTFNISTATALVCAGMGLRVAKHGNRAVSSRCGSADVLEALGVDVGTPLERAADLMDAAGLAFLFAPTHHPAMRHAMPVRRALGTRTVFNVLGPLTNPAGVRRQLLGVFRQDLCAKLAHVLGRLGAERAFVVRGHDGADELSLVAPTHVAELRDGTVREFSVTPEGLGLSRCAPEDLMGGDAAVNAGHVRAVLDGAPGPRRDVVLLNAGFCAVLGGLTEDPAEGVAIAAEAVDEGRAAAALATLAARTRAARVS